ncbi:MAG: GNAT family N-acetyltransferase [Bacteroidota bacterium]
MKEDVPISPITPSDYSAVEKYYAMLGESTKKRFAPHAFNRNTLHYLFESTSIHWAYLAKVAKSIIGYAVLRRGIPDHDLPRMDAYGLTCDQSDCLFAPSIADHWQNKGIGHRIFETVLDNLPTRGIKRVFLWGGVQATNHQAVRYYDKLGFQELGSFEYHGMNYDMILKL